MSAVTYRPLGAADLGSLCQLIRRSEARDGIPRVVEPDELAEDFDDVRIRFATDTLAAWAGGELVAAANTYLRPSEQPDELAPHRCYLSGSVDPAWRGRGLGRHLLAWSVERGRDQLRELPSPHKLLAVQNLDRIESAARLYRRLGFTPVRYYDDLLRSLAQRPLAVTVPGVRIVPWPEGRDEEIRQVKNAAFADHWASSPTSVRDWESAVHGYGARPDLSFVALADDGSVVGHCLNHRYEADDNLLGRRDGWLDSIGTLAPWRGRGVASALIVASLGAFAAAGLTHAALSVDSDNPTGAPRLYRALGFEPWLRWVAHAIPIEPLA